MTNRATPANLCATLSAAAVVLLVWLLAAEPALAQCAMCKASAAALDEAAARSLNFAVLLLLGPPVAIFCAIFFVAYRRGGPPGAGDEGGRE